MTDQGPGRPTADGPGVVLLVSAQQMNKPLNIEAEQRAVRRGLAGANVRPDYLPAANAESLVSDVSEARPRIVHFIGHGSLDGIELAYEQSYFESASGEALRAIFDGKGVQLVVLNACYSASQANALLGAVGAVVGTSGTLADQATPRFSGAFYRALARGGTVGEAMQDGVAAVGVHLPPDRQPDMQLIGDRTLRPLASFGPASASGQDGVLDAVSRLDDLVYRAIALVVAALLASAAFYVLLS